MGEQLTSLALHDVVHYVGATSVLFKVRTERHPVQATAKASHCHSTTTHTHPLFLPQKKVAGLC